MYCKWFRLVTPFSAVLAAFHFLNLVFLIFDYGEIICQLIKVFNPDFKRLMNVLFHIYTKIQFYKELVKIAKTTWEVSMIILNVDTINAL